MVGGKQDTVSTFTAELDDDHGKSQTGAESCHSAWEGPMGSPGLLEAVMVVKTKLPGVT